MKDKLLQNTPPITDRHALRLLQTVNSRLDTHAPMPLFSNHQIELLENDRLKNQLLSLMRRTNPGGRDSVVPGAGDSSHSDLAKANAGGSGEGPRARAYYDREMVKALKFF